MLQLTPQSRIFLAVQPVDFRKGIDGLAALCRNLLHENPLGGTIYVFRNRTGSTLKLLVYDGQGFWYAKRLPTGVFPGGRPRHPERDTFRVGTACS
jgi:transposase